MPDVLKYFQLGSGKLLHQIVMAGSHDAAITSGGGNVQTQAKNIKEQAQAGVRLFDLRISGQSVSKTGTFGKTHDVELKAVHATGYKGSSVKSSNVGFNKLKVSNAMSAHFGMGLTDIMEQARQFVEENPTEFVILKFDKCINWTAIAVNCILGARRHNTVGTGFVDFIGKTNGSLNLKSLDDLKGKVYVCFSKSGYAEVKAQMAHLKTMTHQNNSASTEPSDFGILKWENLLEKGTFDPQFIGFQYIGKGGTNWKKGGSALAKMTENTGKQWKRLSPFQFGTGRLQGHPEILGMLYWTTTGAFENIENRNDFLWQKNNVYQMKELWRNCAPSNVDPTKSGAAVIAKQFMPNFVMVDFADISKCKRIAELNMESGQVITDVHQRYAKYLDDLR